MFQIFGTVETAYQEALAGNAQEFLPNTFTENRITGYLPFTLQVVDPHLCFFNSPLNLFNLNYWNLPCLTI